MVFCTYCGNSFTRDEHLERHILTHTNVKPFKCFTCHMSFARRDLLQRHYTVHGRNQNQQEIPAANGMIPKTAGRTPIACTNCAKTKTKCDKKFPCSRCTARNLRCTIRPTRRSTKNAERLGLITAETIAQSVANGILPPDQTVAAEKIAIPVDSSYVSPPAPGEHRSPQMRHHSTSSCCSSGTPPSSTGLNNAGADASAPALDPNNTCSTPPEPHSLSPTTPINNGSITGSTPLNGFDEFGANKLTTDESSPRFMLDWQQLQFPNSFDPALRNDLFIGQDMSFDMTPLQFGQTIDPSFALNTELSQSAIPGPLLTPLETPVLERTFSDTDVATFSGHHSRHHSLISNHTLDTLNHLSIGPQLQRPDPVIAAQDGWNAFRCVSNVPSNACPATANWNLELLENSLKNHDVWNTWAPDVEEPLLEPDEQLAVMQLHTSTRDKLLAITQGFLHRAMEIHRSGSFDSDSRSFMPSNFILLPPTKVLEYFLRSYINSFERYYPVTNRGALDANELMHCHHDKASSLLILLMIAQGALNTSSAEARSLAPGLVETCRISLFDLVERNVHMATDHNVLHGALLFTSLAAWSGDKWQMDIAMGQRGIYTAMLRHSRMLERQTSQQPFFPDSHANIDQMWNAWIQQESQSRLVYSWAMLDQELALFHDTAPLFSVTEFSIALPQCDGLWKARSAGEWSSKMNEMRESQQSTESSFGSQPHCLRDLFRRFLDDEMQSIEYPLTAVHLRLLLHPLQSMVCHYSQLMSCFSDSGSSRVKNKTVTASSTRCRVEEVQCLLQRWYGLADAYMKVKPMCGVMQASLVLYHLISLNAVTDFTQVELLARRETFDGTYQSLIWTHKRCISDVGEAVFHCGQVLRVARGMSRQARPSWWAAAIYRATLVLWCDSLINKDDSSTYGSKSGQTLAIDALLPDHPSIVRYLNKGEGIPCLSKGDGSSVGMDHGVAVLGHCIEMINDGACNRLQSGICNKLDRLMRS
ncbi:transcription factor [Myriangium duriaei CBS 260.36]|uniref:Transcription factor n=1 Tax=Myriangium duriaei CBS 260.36 TaxID=1168546 RepID=A0A9P4J867_9PEZI|nr:transcription factor [Myriangium duriaei CBS 260.36]